MNGKYYYGTGRRKSSVARVFLTRYTLLDVQVLNAANFGVPQQRNRVVFLAYRNDVAPLQYPESDNDIPNATVYDALGDLYGGKFSYKTD